MVSFVDASRNRYELMTQTAEYGCVAAAPILIHAFERRPKSMLSASMKSVSSRVSMSAEHLGCTRTGYVAAAQKLE